MKQIQHRFIFLMLGLLFFQFQLSAQQVAFRAEYNSMDLFVGSPFKVSFVLDNAEIKGIRFPNFESDGFDVVQGPINETHHANVNNKPTYSEVYIFVLSPKRSGNMTLGSANVVTTKGDSLSSIPIDIYVGAVTDKKAFDLSHDSLQTMNGNVLLRFKTDKATVKAGEVLNISMDICTRIDLTEIIYHKESELVNLNAVILKNAFSAEAYIDDINLQQYACKALDKMEIYPLEAGTLALTPFVYDIKPVQFNENLRIQSDSLTIRVLDFDQNPETNAVDLSSLDCRLIDDSKKNQGILKFEVNISGKGFPGFFKLDPKSFSDKADFSYEVADCKFGGKNDSLNSRRLIYTLRLKENGDFSFQPRCSFWDSRKESVSIISGTNQTVKVVKKAAQQKEDKNKHLNDIVILVDLSSSMLAQDYSPDRLSYIKKILKKTVYDKEKSDRLAISGFTTENFEFCPLTENIKKLNDAIDSLNVGKMPEGTSFGDPLLNAMQLLYRSPARQKTIVVFSDFVINSHSIYNSYWLAQIAGFLNIHIVTAVVGSNGKGLGPIAKNPDGSFLYDTVDLEIDINFAEQIATLSGGSFIKTSESNKPSLKDFLKEHYDNKNTGSIKSYLIEALFGI
jgi:Mg-chelatase subunit ChlD